MSWNRLLSESQIWRLQTSGSRSSCKASRVMYFLCAGERLERQRLRFKFKSHFMIKRYRKMTSYWVLSSHLTSSHQDRSTFFRINDLSLDSIIWKKSRSLIYSIRFQSPFQTISTSGHQRMRKLLLLTIVARLLRRT